MFVVFPDHTHLLFFKLHLIFAVYVIIRPKYGILLSLKMDFVLANSADPDEMTHRLTFHLGLPCLVKNPLGVSRLQRVYKGLTSLKFGYKN